MDFQTQFAGSDLEALKSKASEGRANQMSSSKAKLPVRSITPSHSRQRLSTMKNSTDEQEASTLSTTKSSNSRLHVAATASNAKAPIRKQTSDADSLALNIRKSMQINDSQRNKTKSRGVSPLVRSRVAAHVADEFPDEAPPNLWTDHRPMSASRGRIGNPTGFRSRDPTPRANRQSRSPSPSMSNGWNQFERTQKQLRNQKERSMPGTKESKAHVMGSKMVEKVVNARKSATNQAERNKTQAYKI